MYLRKWYLQNLGRRKVVLLLNLYISFSVKNYKTNKMTPYLIVWEIKPSFKSPSMMEMRETVCNENSVLILITPYKFMTPIFSFILQTKLIFFGWPIYRCAKLYFPRTNRRKKIENNLIKCLKKIIYTMR